MRLLITGDRDWTDAKFIKEHLSQMRSQIDVLIEGEARGVDRLARIAAQELNIPVLPFPANWKKYGKAAGPIRNQQMLKEGKPTCVWAFHDNLEESKGTKDMVARAVKAHLPVSVFTHKNE